MNYIVNPMWFYWINVLNNISFILALVIIVLFLVLSISTPIVIYNYNEYLEYFNNDKTKESYYKKVFKWIKCGFISLIISSIVIIVIPSEETIYKMMIAKYATSDNVEMVLEKITEGVDYIFDKIEESEK